MKACLSIFLFYLLAGIDVYSQNRECVLSNLYETKVYDVKPLFGGKWAVAIQDLSFPAALGEEYFSIAIVDSLGRLDKMIPTLFQYDNETSSGGPLWTLPNDEMIVEYRTGNCDAGYHSFEIEKIDTLGNVLWHQFKQWPRIISDLWIAPDGNYMVKLSEGNLGKISSETGETIWEHELHFPYTSFLPVPGTEDLIVTDSAGLKYYQNTFQPDDVFYNLLYSSNLDFSTDLFYLRGIDEDGLFYGIKALSKELYRFDLDFNLEFITVAPNTQVYISKEHLLFRNPSPGISLQVYDRIGNFIDEITFKREDGFSLEDIYLSPTGLAVIGHYVSGPSPDIFPGFLIYGRSQGWFRYFPNYDFTDAPQKYSLAITDIKQLEPVEVDSFYSPGPDYNGNLYDLSGGKYNIQVTNTGTDTVQSFSINIVFSEIINYWFCPPISAVYKFYDHQGIGPGESAWVEFEGLTAYSQKVNPPKFCFWTSEINHRPDDVPEDDRYCFDRVVKTNFPVEDPIAIYPNPADEEIYILNLPNYNSVASWALFDAMGRKIKAGKIIGGEEKLKIEIQDLSFGVYFIQIGKISRRFIVQH